MSSPIEMMLENAAWTPIEGVIEPSDKTLPYATHSGVLTIGDVRLKCWQLSTGQRLIDAGDMAQFFWL